MMLEPRDATSALKAEKILMRIRQSPRGAV
ncbi:MAG: Uncharacterised protein [SAR116 cluster bacterium]|nr:MAG: Uncharacterised protein [SAR116 cluster bacterium]